MAEFQSSANERDSLSSNESFLLAIEETPSIDNVSTNSSSGWTTATPEVLFVETVVERFLMKFILPVIIVVGTVGNILSIAVLIRSKMRCTSVYFYLMVLAFADLCVLYVSGFKTWIRIVADFELLHVSSFTCKATLFLLLFCLHFSAWLVVLTTVDRFIAVWFPFRAAVWCSVGRARLLTVALMVVIGIYNAHVFWTMSLYGQTVNRPSCKADPKDLFMKAPFEYLKLATYSIFPFVIILTLNILIIARLKWSTLFLRKQDSSSLRSVPSCNVSACLGRHAKVTYMLLAVSFTYLLLTGPFTIVVLAVPSNPGPSLRAKLMLVKAVCFLLMYCNHAVNFFLYCLTGRKFRYELKELFAARRFKKTRRFSIYSPSSKTQPTNLDMELQEAMTLSPDYVTNSAHHHPPPPLVHVFRNL